MVIVPIVGVGMDRGIVDPPNLVVADEVGPKLRGVCRRVCGQTRNRIWRDLRTVEPLHANPQDMVSIQTLHVWSHLLYPSLNSHIHRLIC